MPGEWQRKFVLFLKEDHMQSWLVVCVSEDDELLICFRHPNVGMVGESHNIQSNMFLI